MSDNASVLEALTNVLDDALLELPERDREALLLRYVQHRNLKQVGELLGVTEDTAQKRVAKAVEKLTAAFRKRGYTVPGIGLTIAVLDGAAHTAPLGVVASATTAALSAAAPVITLGGTAVLLSKFMALTNTQIAAMCLLIGATPVAYQWQQNANVSAQRDRLQRAVQENSKALADFETERAARQREWMLGENDLAALHGRVNRASQVPEPKLPPDEELYAWSEESEYVRLPKAVLGRLRLTAPARAAGEGRGRVLDKSGNVSPVLLEALGLNEDQVAKVQWALMNFSADFEALVEARTYLTNAMPPGVGFHHPADVEIVTLRTPGFPEEGAELQKRLRETLESSIGRERTEIFLEKQAARDLESQFLDFGKFDNWVAAADQRNGTYTVARSRTYKGASYNASVKTVYYPELPEKLKVYLAPPLPTIGSNK